MKVLLIKGPKKIHHLFVIIMEEMYIMELSLHFEKRLDCQEGPKHFAKVQNLDCTIAFKTLHSNHELIGTYSYTVTDQVHEVPVMDITGICVNVKVENNSYVIDFVNNNFFQ